jgi:hypothetical protein
MSDEKKKTFLDALQLYYKYKTDYESKYMRQKKKKLNDLKGLSDKEKRRELKKIKRKCISCGKPVGTLFSDPPMKMEDGRHLTIMCGDRANPCSLKVDINLGIIYNLPDEVSDSEETIAGYKKEIINDKNDLLFGYITPEEAVEKFEEVKTNMAQSVGLYEFMLSSLINITANKEQGEKQKKIQNELYLHIESVKELMSQYESEKNTQFAHDAVEIYVNDMLPKLKELYNTKEGIGFCEPGQENRVECSYRGVEFNPDDNTYHLIVKPYFQEEIEVDLVENGQKVVSMVVGKERKISKKKVAPTFQVEAVPDIEDS